MMCGIEDAEQSVQIPLLAASRLDSDPGAHTCHNLCHAHQQIERAIAFCQAQFADVPRQQWSLSDSEHMPELQVRNSASACGNMSNCLQSKLVHLASSPHKA